MRFILMSSNILQTNVKERISKKSELRFREVLVKLKSKKELVQHVREVSNLVFLEAVVVCSVQDQETTVSN